VRRTIDTESQWAASTMNSHAGSWQLHCPVTITPDDDRVMLAHGEGGRMMRRMIEQRIIKHFPSATLAELSDAARLPAVPGPLALTTDSFVVSPLFFPGGEIGTLAVFGTTNDLAVSGAEPLYLTLSLILEEGLPLTVLDYVLLSAAQAARQVGVEVVAGDTKVVPHGAADGLFINTTGVGRLASPTPPGPQALRPGDELIVTGPIGRHGIAVLCAREELALEPPPQSDCASLARAASSLRERVGDRCRAMRDATRGGVAAVLHEWSAAAEVSIEIDAATVPVSSDVHGACELLGLDPLHIASEGTMVVAVAAGAADAAIAALHSVPETAQATTIGRVTERQIAPVLISRTLGSPQPLDEPSGAPLPRIC